MVYVILFQLVNTIFLVTPKASLWAKALIWMARTVTILVVLRNFVAPYVIGRVSNRIRVRSISLRSIRGIYFRKGARTWTIDRIGISYRGASGNASNRFIVKIEGLKVDIGREGRPEQISTAERRRKRMTLSDLDPSPLAFRIWSTMGLVYCCMEPYLRPIIRSITVTCLRIIIQCLPAVSQALHFDLGSAEITFADSPQSCIRIKEATLHTLLNFTQMENAMFTEDNDTNASTRRAGSLSMAALKIRLTKSFGRTWEKAWGETRGAASVRVTLKDISGLGPLSKLESISTKPFLSVPGSIDFTSSLSFSPSLGTIDDHSLIVDLNLGDVHVCADTLLSLLATVQNQQDPEIMSPVSAPVQPNSPPLSPILAATMSPIMDTWRSASKRSSLLPLRTLRKTPNRAIWASKLDKAQFRLSSLAVSKLLATGEKYEATILDIAICAGLSSPDQNALHYQHFGRRKTAYDKLDPEVYQCGISAQRAHIDRAETDGHSHLRVVSIGRSGLDIVVSQWPHPWFSVSPFMKSDPNAAFLAAHLSIGNVEITEQLEALQRLVASTKPSTPSSSHPFSMPSMLLPMPRLALSLDFGSFCGRLICVDEKVGPFAVEARTDGFACSFNSEFIANSYSASRPGTAPPPDDCTLLRMAIEILFVSKPAFMRVRFDHQFGGHNLSPSETSDLGESLISLETIEFIGRGNASGTVGDGVARNVSIDTSSLVLDLHGSTEVLSIDLWHPGVMAAVAKLATVWASQPQSTGPSIVPSRLLDRLPSGLSCTFSLARCTVFVTSPDLNPAERINVSRGVAFCTGVHLHYCAVRARHLPAFEDLADRTDGRHRLRLQKERIVEAVAEARMSKYTEQSHAFGRVTLWDSTLRSAVASEFAQDNPFFSEKDDPALKSKRFLEISHTTLDFNVWGRRGQKSLDHMQDNCGATLLVPSVQGTFQLLHVYSTILAATVVKSLFPHRDATSAVAHKPPSTLLFQIKAKIGTLQFMWSLRSEKFATRIDSVVADLAHNKPSGLKWGSLLVWVPILHRVNRWEDSPDERWEELLRLQKCDLALLSSSKGTSIVLQGAAARLRIPPGFILAHLVQDLGLTVKCVRHLVKLSEAGVYSDMSTPVAEPAKAVPNIRVRIDTLSFEVADDPLESKLGLIWRTGFEACRQRLDREDAFKAKVTAILAAEAQASQGSSNTDSEYHFTPQHTVSVQEAHVRLSMVHAVDWVDRLRDAYETRSQPERLFKQRFSRHHAATGTAHIPDIVSVTDLDNAPPLFRALLEGLDLHVSKPSFPDSEIPGFLQAEGNGLPTDSKFSLLVPMHLKLSLASLSATLRDYPIPLLDIKRNPKPDIQAFMFDSDLIIAEEMGTSESVEWIGYPIVGVSNDIDGAESMSIEVPKTIMPVKSYACPTVQVAACEVTSFAWGVSYGAATQDLTRAIETLTTGSLDPSPPLAFWDKMRLVFHWRIQVVFAQEVRLHLKGTRDPYNTEGAGAGFAFCWQGRPTLLINYENPDRELIQMNSESMLIVIPNFPDLSAQRGDGPSPVVPPTQIPSYRKICAKLTSGTRFGVGCVVERSCGTECSTCKGSPFERKCRIFDFRPHYDIRLEQKAGKPTCNSPDDSYNQFRSDFIHLSVSVTSSLGAVKPGQKHSPSNLYLTPKAFAHFWSWWALFEGVMSIPIRQGSYYPPKQITPKFGRHLATLKYRISVSQLFITHAYIDDSRESWADGVTPFIGIKAKIEKFQADMHQRDQESIVPGRIPDAIKVVRHKPFYAAEVVLDGIDLRTMVAVFQEPLKQTIDLTSTGQRSDYRAALDDLPITEESSIWFDNADFVETDWSSDSVPTLNLLRTAACARLTYLKRVAQPLESPMVTSKFGEEHTHSCLLGQESSVSEVQIKLALARIAELRQELAQIPQDSPRKEFNKRDIDKRLALLNDYIAQLREVARSSNPGAGSEHAYYMPSDSVSPDEWSEFDNVYQVHNPNIFINNAIRDILIRYYHCSRSWRGYEYHMATRAVKFIRDQAEAAISTSANHEDKPKGYTSSAHAAANALRKILTGEKAHESTVQVTEEPQSDDPDHVDPLSGWSDGVSLSKSHFCLLLKPQIVLRSETSVDHVCVLAAVHAKLQAFAIMDVSNAEDPISGKVMSRSYTSLDGLQTFSPTQPNYRGDGCVPLEVLIDFRCESNEFDRLVPQTNATFHYDKFNPLRLRNNLMATTRAEEATSHHSTHLFNETDLVRINVPRFTVSASDKHFEDISNIITKLVLFSNAAHASHVERLETLIFAYDFTDLPSSANVVADLQRRLRNALETRGDAERRFRSIGYNGSAEILQLKAHIFLLSEELNLMFDAIKLAQNRTEDDTDQKSALLLRTSASEISWRMLDDRRDLLAKLAMRKIDYSWLSRQDSSTVNHLSVGDLQAWDGSPHAVWPEILSKHNEPANHPLLKRDIFFLADWTVLAPVGGITIYQNFELSFHPMRLQVDAKVGSRMLEYVWPARKQRALAAAGASTSETPAQRKSDEEPRPSRKSMDSSRALNGSNGLKPPALRRLGTSRSFTDLRGSIPSDSRPPSRSGTPQRTRTLDKFRSRSQTNLLDPSEGQIKKRQVSARKAGDAAEMKTRSSQKTFILVKISSLNLLLSMVKEESFDLRDAHIRTRELEYRNQTSSFEELVDQFIPSDMGWKGWVKMAFHQPLVPVLPVARELLSKTKWIASKGTAQLEDQAAHKAPKLLPAKANYGPSLSDTNHSYFSSARMTSEPISAEDESTVTDERGSRAKSRSRMMSLFRPSSSRTALTSPPPEFLVRERSGTITPRPTLESPGPST